MVLALEEGHASLVIRICKAPGECRAGLDIIQDLSSALEDWMGGTRKGSARNEHRKAGRNALPRDVPESILAARDGLNDRQPLSSCLHLPLDRFNTQRSLLHSRYHARLHPRFALRPLHRPGLPGHPPQPVPGMDQQWSPDVSIQRVLTLCVGWHLPFLLSVAWDRVATDATNFSIVLTNLVSFVPPDGYHAGADMDDYQDRAVLSSDVVLADLVDATSANSISVSPPSSGWPTPGGSYRVNLVKSKTEQTTIYAQSTEFNITAGAATETAKTTASGSQTTGTGTRATGGAKYVCSILPEVSY